MLKRVLLNFYLTNSMNFNTEHPTLMRLIYSIKPPGKAMHENGRSDLTPRILTAESCLKLKIPLSYDNNLFKCDVFLSFQECVYVSCWP